MKTLMIGGPELIIIFILIPIIIFILGFYFGKKSGYLKRIKETENQTKN